MNRFSDFGITVPTDGFTGKKIKVSKVLNCMITVHSFLIKDSKINSGDCLYMQIEYQGSMRVIFTGSVTLMKAIKQVPKKGFPFQTTIIEEDERYVFT